MSSLERKMKRRNPEPKAAKPKPSAAKYESAMKSFAKAIFMAKQHGECVVRLTCLTNGEIVCSDMAVPPKLEEK